MVNHSETPPSFLELMIRRLSLKGSQCGTITDSRRYGTPSPKHAGDERKEEGDDHHPQEIPHNQSPDQCAAVTPRSTALLSWCFPHANGDAN